MVRLDGDEPPVPGFMSFTRVVPAVVLYGDRVARSLAPDPPAAAAGYTPAFRRHANGIVQGHADWLIPGTAVVEGKVVVTRTDNAGKTFKTLRKGLPQKHAYDLVFRHALDVDETGERLAFGSTTGSVWVSEGGGDSWQTIANHLPPVLSVEVQTLT